MWFILLHWGVGVHSLEKFQFLPSCKLETVFPALGLTRNFYINEKNFFLKTGNVIIYYLPLPCKHSMSERLCSQSDTIWKQGDFRNPNFPTPLWIRKNLEVQTKLRVKNLNFPSLSWIGKNFRSRARATFKKPESPVLLCIGKNYSLRPTFKNSKFKSMN